MTGLAAGGASDAPPAAPAAPGLDGGPALWSPRHPALWLGAITAASILTQGYLFGVVNQGLQLPLIRHFAGDTTFAHDAAVQELLRTYTSAFYPAMGYAARWIPLPWLFFATFVLVRLGNIYFGYRLSLALWRDGAAALWAAAALSLHTVIFSGHVINDLYLTHGAAAQMMALAALWLLATHRVVPAFAVAGLLFNVHGLLGAHLAAVMAIAVVTGGLARRDLLRLLVGCAVALLLMSPTVAWMLQAGVAGQPEPPGYLDALHGWVSPHYWMSSWTPAEWILLLVPWLVAVPLARLAGGQRDGGTIARAAIAALVCATAGGVLSELWDSGFLVRFHPLRWGWVTFLAGVPFFTRAALQLIRRWDRPEPLNRVAGALGTAMLVALGISFLYRNAFVLTLAPALWFVTSATARTAAAARGRTCLLASLIGLAVLVPAAFVAQVDSDAWALVTDMDVLAPFFILQGLIGALAAGVILAAWLRPAGDRPVRRERRLLLGAAGAVAGLHLLGRTLVIASLHVQGPVHDWREVQNWCASNLPPGARVIVPLTADGLRSRSNQIPVVDFLEGAVMTHSPQYMAEYRAKLTLFGYTGSRGGLADNLRDLNRLDRTLTASQVRDIARHTGALVAVRRLRYSPWDLPLLFRNRTYAIYQP